MRDVQQVEMTEYASRNGAEERDEMLPVSEQVLLQQQHVSWARIYSLCIVNFGINFAWALEFAITTPYFEKTLQAGQVVSHTVWIVGPLSGLIVAPIVGTLSDRCTSRFGRRRPFILVGMIATLLGMATFSRARQIAAVFVKSDTEIHRLVSIATAILAFCLLDLALNTTMWPVRALQKDLVPNMQQHSVQSASIVMFSFGDLFASGLIHSFNEPVSKIGFCFLVAAIVYTVSVVLLLIIGKETPLRPNESAASDPEKQPINIISYLRSLPPWMWRVGGSHALGFFALFCLLPNASTWLGTTVLQGDPQAKENSKKALAYGRGVSLYGNASRWRSLVQIAYSAVYPFLLRFMSEAQLMGISFASFGALLMVFAATQDVKMGQVVVVMMALPIAAHFLLPVGLTMKHSDESNSGRYLGALNCFAVIPQIIDTMYTGFVSEKFGEAWVMRIAAGWSLLAGVFAFFKMRVD